MKLQKIILCMAIALTAFGASLGLLEIGAYIRAAFQPMKVKFEPLEPVRPPVFVPERIPDFPMPPITPTEEPAPVEESEPDDWGHSGDYYILDDKPEGFEDFSTLSIEDRAYDEKSEKVVPIKPKGTLSVLLKDGENTREFKLSQLDINGKRVSLVSETKRRVSYRFEGRFVEEEATFKTEDGEEYTETVYLKGRLSKWRDGKKIAETKVKFTLSHGC